MQMDIISSLAIAMCVNIAESIDWCLVSSKYLSPVLLAFLESILMFSFGLSFL